MIRNLRRSLRRNLTHPGQLAIQLPDRLECNGKEKYNEETIFSLSFHHAYHL